MNFSLLSWVQSFLQVLTATLIFSPFCNRSIWSRALPRLERVSFPILSMTDAALATTLGKADGVALPWHLTPAYPTPHFCIFAQALLLFPFLLGHSVLELERASETRKLSPCVQMRIHSHVICPRPAGIRQNTQGLLQKKAGPPSLSCWLSTILLPLGSAFSSLPKYNHIGKAHPGFSDLDTKSCWSHAGPDLTASFPISPSAFSHQPQSPMCFHP